jgi:hypothetical protein
VASFRDSTGFTYELRITVRTLGLVREATGVDIGRIGFPAGKVEVILTDLEALLLDTEKFAHVLYAMVKSQRENYQLEQFLEDLEGDELEEARMAFTEAFAFFCPAPIRKVLLKVLDGEALKQQAAAAMTQALEKVYQISSAEISLETSKLSAGSSPAVLASTPAT